MMNRGESCLENLIDHGPNWLQRIMLATGCSEETLAEYLTLLLIAYPRNHQHLWLTPLRMDAAIR
jgi:hypothetical protein